MGESKDDYCIVSLYLPIRFWEVLRSRQRRYTLFDTHGLKTPPSEPCAVKYFYRQRNTKVRTVAVEKYNGESSDSLLAVRITLANFEYRSVVTTMN